MTERQSKRLSHSATPSDNLKDYRAQHGQETEDLGGLLLTFAGVFGRGRMLLKPWTLLVNFRLAYWLGRVGETTPSLAHTHSHHSQQLNN